MSCEEGGSKRLIAKFGNKLLQRGLLSLDSASRGSGFGKLYQQAIVSLHCLSAPDRSLLTDPREGAEVVLLRSYRLSGKS